MKTENLLLDAIQCATLDELMHLVADYLDQTVLIADQAGRIISGNQSVLSQVPTDWLAPTTSADVYRQGAQEFVRTLINPLALNRWYLVVSQSKGYPLDSNRLQLAVRIINRFIDRYSLNPNQSEVNSLFAKLLTNPTTNTALLRPLIDQKIICVTVTPQLGASNQTAFIQALRNLIAPLPLTADDRDFVFLLNAADLPTLQPQLTDLGTTYHHCFFISESYTDLAKTIDFRRICQQATHIAEQLGTMTVINATQKYNIYIILSQVENAPLLKNTMCSQLLFLRQYDEQHHSELFKTLFNFLENDCKINFTADQLHLHRNSLTKRLQKIQDLIEIDFDNPDKTFGLRLSYRLFNFLQL